MEIYDITVKDRHEKDVSLSIYRGMVLLIINTATDCIFTPQYVGLQDLYWKLNASGFEILDFPCNQFAGQAPGTSEEIFDFSFSNFGITFPQFAKIDVNGPNESPLYTFLKAKYRASSHQRSNGISPSFSLTGREGSSSVTGRPPSRKKSVKTSKGCYNRKKHENFHVFLLSYEVNQFLFDSNRHRLRPSGTLTVD